MKRFIWTFAIIALITSCKTQRVVPLVIRDSVSVTYHPGTVLSLTDSTDFTDSAPTCGGAITVKPQHDGLTSQAQRCSSARPLQIPQKVRVDTLIVERWHTEIVESQKKKVESSEPDKPIPRFYKDCTKGFWILLILLLGRIAFKLSRLFYLRR